MAPSKCCHFYTLC